MSQSISRLPKDAKDHIPYCSDQGIPNITGTPSRGVGLQSFQTTMPNGGVIALPFKMENTSYRVYIHNHTREAMAGLVANSDRAINQITVTGPTNGDVLDILIIGQLQGQLI